MNVNRNSSRFLATFSTLVLGLIVFLPSQVASAATITVTTTFDGTGGPDCTLRDAIVAANTDTSRGGCPAGYGPDTITLAEGATYILTMGEFVIQSQINIEGNGSVIERSSADGTPEFRIFYLSPDGNLTLNDLTISNGANPYEGGGVKNYSGTLTLKRSTINGNRNGGIINLYGASLNIYNSLISANSGGGIINLQGSVVIDHSTISGNIENRNGGGIHNYSGSVDIENSTIRDNTGAGIVNLYGEVDIENSTFSGNIENTNGGGIHNYYGSADIKNSTFSGNTASSNGGGIYNRGELRITNSTISENIAAGNGGGICNYGASLELANTIIASQSSGADCSGTVTSLGYNLDSDGTCNLSSVGDFSGADPHLGPLQDNGGPTRTHALLFGSPAMDGVPVSDCPLNTDQRGVSRPKGMACDIGAFELEYSAIEVEIDIKPDSDLNSINLWSNGKVSVAVLTTDIFDANNVDPVTVLFAGASPLSWVIEDVDYDGDMDLIFHFKTQELSICERCSEATLTGKTIDEELILGKDSVQLVPGMN